MTRNTNPARSCCHPLWVAAALAVLAAPTPASSIFAVAGSGALMPAADTVKASWNSVAPNPLSQIQWFVGDSVVGAKPLESVDGVNIPNQALAPPQAYLPGGAVGPLGPVSATFGGPAPVNSTATNSGAGLSRIVNLNGIGPAVNASWSATATGTLGTKAGASWHAVTTAKDPWAIGAANFSNMPGPTFDLFFLAGLTGADLDSADSSLSLDVSYQTGAGTEDLLNLSADRAGAQVTIGSVPGLEIYLLSSITDGPNDVTGPPLKAANIQALLMGLVNTGNLSTPLLFGLELNGQPIPTQDLGGGVVAWMNVDGTVTDGAAGPGVPEPASLSLFAAGGVLIVLGRLRQKS